MKFAAVFPGQGSQSVGMLTELARNHNEVKDTFQEASNLLDKDLWSLITNKNNIDYLNQTENTQPIMLASGVAIWRLWLSNGGCPPVGVAGHSLGEYCALVASEVLSFNDAILLVSERAKLMQLAVPKKEGAMAAVLGLSRDIVTKVCKEVSFKYDGVVDIANFNSPEQIVISGSTGAVDCAIKSLVETGAIRVIKLPVSVPSHCSLMKGIAKDFYNKLSNIKFSKSILPVLHNVDASIHNNTEQKRLVLSDQLYSPVYWTETVLNFGKNYKVDTIIEFGPGKVLFNLNRKINRNMSHLYICDEASLEKSLKLCSPF